jgi:hypothetical protein
MPIPVTHVTLPCYSRDRAPAASEVLGMGEQIRDRRARVRVTCNLQVVAPTIREEATTASKDHTRGRLTLAFVFL